ncbi:MAG: hypothetical protein FJX75_00270 [Armatimonadetes bacterium]|nr:hypothetical protein [Armatimonadota bacterium]
MPKPKTPPERPRLTCSREDAQQKLTARIECGQEIASRAEAIRSNADLDAVEAERRTWNEYNYDLLRELYTTDEVYRVYAGVGFGGVAVSGIPSVAAEAALLVRGLRENIRELESIRSRLDLVPEVAQSVPTASAATTAPSTGVFIVHGHDRTAALELKELIGERFGSLTPVLLDREAHQGRTLIEKLEQVGGGCGYAFAIWTPDDSVETADASYRQMRPNVLFEVGWFYGKLGRSRTCVLYRRGTAVPTDLLGIGWHEFGTSVRDRYLEIEAEIKAAYGHNLT